MTKKKPGIVSAEKIHLTQVFVFRCILEAEESYLDDPQQPVAFETSFAYDNAVNENTGRLRFRLYFEIDALDANEKYLGIDTEIGIEFHFAVDNFQDFVLEDEKKGSYIDKVIGGTLLGIAYSTARGIVLERTQNSYLGGALLPVIDPIAAVKENVRKRE